MKYDRILCNATERTRAEKAARVLAEVGDVLAPSLDGETLLASPVQPTSKRSRRKKMNLESKLALSRYAVEHGMIE
ncbi:MAG: hypothetical protein M1132_06440 [Chloroflexi bacterium]|nr:hypothetical protein [Chloroflexota bacterium]